VIDDEVMHVASCCCLPSVSSCDARWAELTAAIGTVPCVCVGKVAGHSSSNTATRVCTFLPATCRTSEFQCALESLVSNDILSCQLFYVLTDLLLPHI